MALRTVALAVTFSWNVRPPRRALARMERALQPKMQKQIRKPHNHAPRRAAA